MKQTPFYYTLRRLLALSVMSLLTLATLSLTSCRHKDTEHDDYGLSAALSWADPSDAGREIKNVRIWIFQAGGKLVAKRQEVPLSKARATPTTSPWERRNSRQPK